MYRVSSVSATALALAAILCGGCGRDAPAADPGRGVAAPPSDATATRAAETARQPVVRRAAVAGRFYPGDPVRLRKSVASYLAAVPDDASPGGRVLAVMAPHAGYVFSAGVAARSLSMLADQAFDTAVIIGHDTGRPGVMAWLCDVDCFETPLGRVPVDREMVRRLLDDDPRIRSDRLLHAREHTVEVQLPFLQVMNRSCRIVPVLFGRPTVEHCRAFAGAIDRAADGKRVVILASTDMTHYPPYEEARRIDRSTLEVLREMNAEKLLAHLERIERKTAVPGLQTAMCAKGGVMTALLYAAAHGADRARVLHYANSGDVAAGSRNRVVGYGAAVFVKTGE